MYSLLIPTRNISGQFYSIARKSHFKQTRVEHKKFTVHAPLRVQLHVDVQYETVTARNTSFY